MKKFTYLAVVAITWSSIPAMAQMPDAPPPSTSKMDPRLEKRVVELKQLGYDKKKNPDAQKADDSASKETSTQPVPTRPKMGRFRRGQNEELRPEASERLTSFASTSRRGRERKKHLLRLAKLERLAALALEAKNDALSRRVIDLRTRENRRHKRSLKQINRSRLKRTGFQTDTQVKIDGAAAQP